MYLLDTNVLVGLADAAAARHPVAARAVAELARRGESLHVTAQNLVEFRNVATRPLSANGLGFSPATAKAQAQAFEQQFPLLAETPDIYLAWKALVEGLGVIGKRVHDARLVAVCHAHGATHLLTFNGRDFAGLSSFGPGLVVVDPANV